MPRVEDFDYPVSASRPATADESVLPEQVRTARRLLPDRPDTAADEPAGPSGPRCPRNASIPSAQWAKLQPDHATDCLRYARTYRRAWARPG
jgi:hypothetical protein